MALGMLLLLQSCWRSQECKQYFCEANRCAVDIHRPAKMAGHRLTALNTTAATATVAVAVSATATTAAPNCDICDDPAALYCEVSKCAVVICSQSACGLRVIVSGVQAALLRNESLRRRHSPTSKDGWAPFASYQHLNLFEPSSSLLLDCRSASRLCVFFETLMSCPVCFFVPPCKPLCSEAIPAVFLTSDICA